MALRQSLLRKNQKLTEIVKSQRVLDRQYYEFRRVKIQNSISGLFSQHDNPQFMKYQHFSSKTTGSNYTNETHSKIGVSKLVFIVATSIGFGYVAKKRYDQGFVNANCLQEGQGELKAGKRNPKLANYRKQDILAHNTHDSGIWVTYNEGVYDISEFVVGHPGGNKILLAAGGSLEPFWDMYAVHKNSDVYEILEEMRIGNIHPDDLTLASPKNAKDDPFANDPARHPALKVNSAKPFNAETPVELLTDNFLTPNALFFVRNHLAVPQVNTKNFRLEVGSVDQNTRPLTLSLYNLKKNFKPVTIASTVQCAGNRRTHMAKYKSVKGLSWGAAAISNAEWTGVKLVDVLRAAGIKEDDYKHIIFQGLDKDIEGSHYEASIPIETAMDPKREVLLAYAMNGEELPLDHGFPLRVVVPGSVGARQVKWLNKIVASDVESDSHWQQKDYKTFSPSTDFNTADFDKAVAIQDYPLQSGICSPQDGATLESAEEVEVTGYAWSGGGRGIIRVEVSADGGKTWHNANLRNADQKLHRQWAWTLYDVTIPLSPGQSKLKLICKAIDTSHNQQPEKADSIWNMRGLIHNAWHKITVNVPQEDKEN